jgi:hypothetical protein
MEIAYLGHVLQLVIEVLRVCAQAAAAAAAAAAAFRIQSLQSLPRAGQITRSSHCSTTMQCQLNKTKQVIIIQRIQIENAAKNS